MTSITSDLQLISAIARGSRKAERALFLKLRQRFWQGASDLSGINEDDKGDILQDSFIILWKKIQEGDIFVNADKAYVKGRNDTKEITDLSGFFMRIVKNKYHEALRSAGKTVSLDERSAQNDDTTSDEHHATDITYRCLMMLPRHCQTLIELFYVQGKSLDEILALRHGLQTYTGLKTAKYKCLKNLKDRIRAMYHEHGLRFPQPKRY